MGLTQLWLFDVTLTKPYPWMNSAICLHPCSLPPPTPVFLCHRRGVPLLSLVSPPFGAFCLPHESSLLPPGASLLQDRMLIPGSWFF